MTCIESLGLEGFLTLPPGSPAFELRPLNVLTGASRSGKSSLIEAFELLAAAPHDFALAGRAGLEQAPKELVNSGLMRGSAKTQKGRDHKIRYASELLSRVELEKVRERCPHCRRLFEPLTVTTDAT